MPSATRSKKTPAISSRKREGKCWGRCASRATRRIFPHSCCRRRARRQRSSGLPMPVSTPAIRSSRRRNSASSRAARNSLGCYWDHDDKTREFSERFFKRTGRMPNMIQAGTYSATLQYLKAVKAAGSKDTEAVAAKLKELPVDDMFAQGGKVLANGRMVHDLYLFEVKKPSESKKPWDYYKMIATVPGDKAFPTAAESGCPLTK